MSRCKIIYMILDKEGLMITGAKERGFEAKVTPDPVCLNSGVGQGNCIGMVRNSTCPKVRGRKGKFRECVMFVADTLLLKK